MQTDTSLTWMRVGGRAVLVTFQNPDHAASAAVALQSAPPISVEDAVCAFEKLLIEFSSPHAMEHSVEPLIHWLGGLTVAVGGASEWVEIPVRYDGEDLVAVARRAGLDPDEVVRRHVAPVYTVALIGFAPGFPYLEGLDASLHTPRRESPRPHMPVGAVAIGGSHTGIYSLPTPGGWNWIGSTDLRLFEPGRDPMVLLRAGDRVKFVPIE